MRIERFQMERTQCLYENEVEYNLSESGVQPLKVSELLDGVAAESRFLDLSLKYPESNGSLELRQRIALFYPGAGPDNVVVTNGGSEANYTTLWALLEKGARAAIMIPNYLQSWGLARAYADRADPYYLTEQQENGRRRWGLDLDSLRRAVTPRTQVVVVTNPNNPTGGVLTESEMDAVVRAARRAGAWIVADEIYRGAEVRGDALTPTFWGRYPKLIITSGLSKAFGLPGLRIGWMVGPERAVAQLCSYHDYLTLTPTMLSERLARIVMEPGRRDELLARTRSIIRRNLPQLEAWIRRHEDIFDYIPPAAGAIALVKYRLPIASAALFERLRVEKSVLVTPGAHFGIGKYLRIGYGYNIGRTLAGLARVDDVLDKLQGRRARPAPRRAARPRKRARR